MSGLTEVSNLGHVSVQGRVGFERHRQHRHLGEGLSIMHHVLKFVSIGRETCLRQVIGHHRQAPRGQIGQRHADAPLLRLALNVEPARHSSCPSTLITFHAHSVSSVENTFYSTLR